MGIAVYNEVESTNALLLGGIDSGDGEGAWVLARRQTAGRGRQGRTWESIKGNLHASTSVRLGAGDPPAATLSLVSAVALYRAFIDVAGIAANRLRIKWPNDLVACRADVWGKIAGILLEREANRVVIGFGANLAHAPDIVGRPVASVAHFGTPPDPVTFCRALECRFVEERERWRSRGPTDTRRRWLDRAHPIGTPISVHISEQETASGTFDGIESDGALRLLTDTGIEVIRAGDVEL